MERINRYLKHIIPIILILSYRSVMAQPVKELKFSVHTQGSKFNDPLSIAIRIDTNQHISPNGLSFTLMVRNKSENTISIGNIVEFSKFNLSNNLGLNIAVPNFNFLISLDQLQSKDWRMQSESVYLGSSYINGKDIGDISERRFIDIPANGTFSAELSIKDVRVIKSSKDYGNILPKVPLSPGIYELRVISYIFYIVSNDNSIDLLASYWSPRFIVNYGKM